MIQNTSIYTDMFEQRDELFCKPINNPAARLFSHKWGLGVPIHNKMQSKAYNIRCNLFLYLPYLYLVICYFSSGHNCTLYEFGCRFSTVRCGTVRYDMVRYSMYSTYRSSGMYSMYSTVCTVCTACTVCTDQVVCAVCAVCNVCMYRIM